MSIDILINISKNLHVSIDYLIFGESNTYGNHCNKSRCLFAKCTEKETQIIEDIIKAILPHL